MTWQKKPGVEHDHIDGRTLQHNIHLYSNVTGAEHHIILLLKAHSCPACHRSFPQSLGHLDPKAAIAEEISILQPNQEEILLYSRMHGVPILTGPLATIVPAGHTMHQSRAGRSLIPPRKP